MKTRFAIAATLFAFLPAIAGESRPVAEFTPEESEKFDWRIVDDGVMGGLSQGKREIGDDGILRGFVWGDQAGKSRGREVVRAGQGGLYKVL
jgi:hypothetical protein